MSTVVTKNVQVGTSGTPAQNFTLYQPASPDGTVRLANGNSGSTTDLLTMTAAGNLGLGVTPSAWGSNNRAYQVAPTGVAWTPALSYVGGEANFSHNCYHDGTSWRFAGTGFGATRLEAGIQGAFRWFSSGNVSGTANNAITFTQAMTLDASGRLGVGTTSPSNPLHVRLTSGGDTAQFEGAGASDSRINITNTGVSNTYIGFNNTGSTNVVGIPTGVAYFANGNAYPIAFSTNNLERARIDSSGNFLVNSTTMSAAGLSSTGTLQVTNEFISRGGQGGVFWENRSGGVTLSTNWYGWYAPSSTASFIYNGNSNIASINNSTGAYTALSDRNKKKDFEPSNVGLAEVMQLKPTLFRMLDEEENTPKQLGFIAQDVRDVISQAYVEQSIVDAGGKQSTYIGLNDRPIIAALTAAIQEQQAIITALTARIESLESK